MFIGSVHIDSEAIAVLPDGQRQAALQKLQVLRDLLQRNPLELCKPHAKQVEFLSRGGPGWRSFFLGGNRSGKTTGGAQRMVIQVVPPEFVPQHLMPYKRWGLDGSPVRGRVVTPDFKQSHQVILSKIQQWVPREALRGGGKGATWWQKAYDKDARTLWFKNGSFIEFMSQEQDPKQFQAQDLHVAWFDEEPLYDIGYQQWSETMARLIDYDGEAWLTMTPLHGMSWVFDQYFAPWEAGRRTDGGEEVHVTQASSTENPYVSERGLQRYFDSLGARSQEELAARKHGSFISFTGLIYPSFSPEKHVVDRLIALPPRGPDRRVVVEGIDPGTRWPLVIFLFADDQGRVTIFDELTFPQGTPIERVCEAIKLKRQEWGYGQPNWSVIDPAARNRSDQTGISTRDEYARHGVRCRLGNNAVGVGTSRGNVLMESPGFFTVTRNCVEFLSEVRKYRWKKGKRAEDAVKEAPVKRDDHAMDAARYGWMSLPEPRTNGAPEGPPEEVADFPINPFDPADGGASVHDGGGGVFA